jgi:hypothetical protein
MREEGEIMRYLLVAAAVLVLASQATAQLPSNVKSVAAPGNGFDLSGIANMFSSLFGIGSSSTSSSSTTNPPQPIAQPQTISGQNTSLASFIPKPTVSLNKTGLGLSTFPTQDQMPGAAYLKAFGFQVAKRVPVN